MGVSDHGPHETNYEEELIQSIHSASILAVTKLENYAMCSCKESKSVH